jgi:pimeloyl-ACP methyl ester carboxylesterase
MADFATEGPRVLLELTRLGFEWNSLLHLAQRGDGHAVMVLPGFMGGDDSTLVLRRFLTRLGYAVLPWLQGRNTGKPAQLEGAVRRFYRAHHAAGDKISLVGQSLGGIYAREIARDLPDAVRCVITLGSPFGGDDETAANPIVQEMFESMSGQTAEAMRARMRKDGTDPQAPPPMPSTAIYSRRDGVAAWHACIQHGSALAENVEVVGSHTGMAMNPDVLRVVADRLAQDPACWQEFDRGRGCNCWIYPKPAVAG